MDLKYRADDLTAVATTLLARAGLPEVRARVVAEVLVEADLMGHSTHGLALLPAYLGELSSGGMTQDGDPIEIRDTGAAVTWDGRHLPGPWLVQQALSLAEDRIAHHPVVTVVIRKSHHIACLAAYLEKLARKGYIVLLACSDPANKTVAPYGGVDGVYSPNPIAAGIPTTGDPIIFDISTSATANGIVLQKQEEGLRLPHPWLLTHAGVATDDPTAFDSDPPATILPLGGMDTGYKGFALGLLIEALTNALCGYGRHDTPELWGGSVFIQVIDPGAFSGRAYFEREMQHLVDTSLASNPIPENEGVRLPGARALALRREQRLHGVSLRPSILTALKASAHQYDVEMPDPVKDTLSNTNI